MSVPQKQGLRLIVNLTAYDSCRMQVGASGATPPDTLTQAFRSRNEDRDPHASGLNILLHPSASCLSCPFAILQVSRVVDLEVLSSWLGSTGSSMQYETVRASRQLTSAEPSWNPQPTVGEWEHSGDTGPPASWGEEGEVHKVAMVMAMARGKGNGVGASEASRHALIRCAPCATSSFRPTSNRCDRARSTCIAITIHPEYYQSGLIEVFHWRTCIL